MKADEMLRNLGYEEYTFLDGNLSFKKDNNLLVFNKAWQQIEIKYSNGMVNTVSTITKDELRAINKMCDELGLFYGEVQMYRYDENGDGVLVEYEELLELNKSIEKENKKLREENEELKKDGDVLLKKTCLELVAENEELEEKIEKLENEIPCKKALNKEKDKREKLERKLNTIEAKLTRLKRRKKMIKRELENVDN